MRLTPEREKEIREAATNYWPCEECAGTLTEAESSELLAEIDALREEIKRFEEVTMIKLDQKGAAE